MVSWGWSLDTLGSCIAPGGNQAPQKNDLNGQKQLLVSVPGVLELLGAVCGFTVCNPCSLSAAWMPAPLCACLPWHGAALEPQAGHGGAAAAAAELPRDTAQELPALGR